MSETASNRKYTVSYNNMTKEITVSFGNENNEPIRVIYEMMKEQKLTYRDLYVSDIAEQFLQIVNQMVEQKSGSADDILAPAEANSLMEFLLIAAQLVREKTEYLRRKYTSGEYDEYDEFFDEFGDGDDDHISVQTMLKSYIQEVEEVMEGLKERETLNRFYAKPMEQFQHNIISYVDFDLNKLYDAIISIQGSYSAKKEQAFGVKIEKERSSVSGKLYALKVLLTKMPRLELNYLLLDTGTLDEKICLFLAVLQLLKQQVARVEYDKEDKCILCVDETWDRVIEEGEKDEFDADK